MNIFITEKDLKLLELILKSEFQPPTIFSILKSNIYYQNEIISINFKNKMDIFGLRNDIIKYIKFILDEKNCDEFINLLNNIDYQYKILDILILNEDEYSILNKLQLESDFIVTFEKDIFYLNFKENSKEINDQIVNKVEDKVSDYLMYYGFDNDYEVNEIGLICESIIDKLFDQLL